MSTETKVWGFMTLFCLLTALLSEGAVESLSLGFVVVFLFFALTHLSIDLVDWREKKRMEESVRRALRRGEE